MKKLLLAFACLSVGSVLAQPMEIPYGQTYTVPFCLYDYTTPNELELPATVTFEAADVRVSQAGTEANSANAPTERTSCYDVVLAATETDTPWGQVIIEDDDNVWLPINMQFITIGHPSAGLPWGASIPGILTGITAAAAGGASNVNVTTTLDGEHLLNAILYLGTCTGGPGARIITTINDLGATVDLNVNAPFDADPNSCPFWIFPANQAWLLTDPTTGLVSVDVSKISGDAVAADTWEDILDGNSQIRANVVQMSVGVMDLISGDIMETIVEPVNNITFKCLVQTTAAVILGTYSVTGAGVVTYREPTGVSDRVVATANPNGTSRSGVTLTCP